MAHKVIILYRLYMPYYFLGTFTEYPQKNVQKSQFWISAHFYLSHRSLSNIREAEKSAKHHQLLISHPSALAPNTAALELIRPEIRNLALPLYIGKTFSS